jgi:predicted nucleic acid-binding protein
VIVDASVVVKWFTTEALHEEARRLLTQSEPLLAPDILAVELANAMWAKTRRGEIDAPEAERAIAAVSGRGLPELRASAPLMLRAFELARTVDHPVYDCVYLALAEALQMPLVTADGRFAAAAQHHGPITLLGER